MSAIISIVTSLLGKIIGPLFALFDRMRQDRISRERGRAEERNRQHDEWGKTQARAEQAAAGVDRMSDAAVRDSLRKRWESTDSAAPSAPVQPRDTSGGSERR